MIHDINRSSSFQYRFYRITKSDHEHLPSGFAWAEKAPPIQPGQSPVLPAGNVSGQDWSASWQAKAPAVHTLLKVTLLPDGSEFVARGMIGAYRTRRPALRQLSRVVALFLRVWLELRAPR